MSQSDSKWLRAPADPRWRVVVDLNGETVHQDLVEGKGYLVLENLIRHEVPEALRERPDARKLEILIEEDGRI